MTAMLWRHIEDVGKLAVVLLGVVFVTVGWVILAGLFRFSPAQAFDFPPQAFQFDRDMLARLGATAMLAMYSYGGYNQVCNIGEEIEDPARTMPRSIVLSIVVVAALYMLMTIVILGMVPWQEAKDTRTIASVFIARTFADPQQGQLAALVMTVLIQFVAAASLYALILGYSRVPFTAARDGHFFPVFARVHPTKHFPHVSLLVVGRGSIPFCFFTLGRPRELDRAGAGAALLRLAVRRRSSCCASGRKDIPQPFQMWLYPLPALLALVLWLYVFLSGPLAGHPVRVRLPGGGARRLFGIFKTMRRAAPPSVSRQRAATARGPRGLLLALLLFRRRRLRRRGPVRAGPGLLVLLAGREHVRIAASGVVAALGSLHGLRHAAAGEPERAGPVSLHASPLAVRALDLLHALRRLSPAPRRRGAYRLARRFPVSPGASFLAGVPLDAVRAAALDREHVASPRRPPRGSRGLLCGRSRLREPASRDALLWGVAIAGRPDRLRGHVRGVGAGRRLAMAARRLRWSRPLGPGEHPLAANRRARLRSRSGLDGRTVAAVAGADRSAQRSALPEVVRTQWSVHPLALLQLAVSHASKGLPSGESTRGSPRTRRSRCCIRSTSAWAFWRWRRPGCWVRAERDAGCSLPWPAPVLVALGRHSVVYGVLVRVLPPLAIVRFPVKAIILAPIAAAVLAGRGFDTWRRDDEAGTRPARRVRSRGAAGRRLRRLRPCSRSQAGTAGCRCRCATRRGFASCWRATCIAPRRRPSWRSPSARSRSGAGRPASRRRSRSRSSWP